MFGDLIWVVITLRSHQKFHLVTFESLLSETWELIILRQIMFHERTSKGLVGVGWTADKLGCFRRSSFVILAGFSSTIPHCLQLLSTDGRWPDLVGRDAEEAKTHILSERPYLNVRIVPTDMMVTMDYNENRVRLFVDDERKVVKCPTIGWIVEHIVFDESSWFVWGLNWKQAAQSYSFDMEYSSFVRIVFS